MELPEFAVLIRNAVWSVPSAPARPFILGQDYFRPFSCKGFYLCPSCSQKRTILLTEHFTEEVLLKLPHRQFVFTFPKALRIYFRNDRKLFAGFSRLIFAMIKEFYKEAAKIEITTGMVIAYQTFGDMLRFNPHFHVGCRGEQERNAPTRLRKIGRPPPSVDYSNIAV